VSADRYIPPWDIEQRIKAAYIVGAITFEQFDRYIVNALRGKYKFAPNDVPYGSELAPRLLVDLEAK
jgi:hypothetical protein